MDERPKIFKVQTLTDTCTIVHTDPPIAIVQLEERYGFASVFVVLTQAGKVIFQAPDYEACIHFVVQTYATCSDF